MYLSYAKASRWSLSKSVKNKEKKKDTEANFANSDDNLEGYNGPIDVSHLDVSDFYEHPKKNWSPC